jgi:hypothetical protein
MLGRYRMRPYHAPSPSQPTHYARTREGQDEWNPLSEILAREGLKSDLQLCTRPAGLGGT